MSRRGKNNVKRAIAREAASSFLPSPAPLPKVATNNFNPLFHYLQTMFPNYDNAVLHAVLEQEGNSIERAIDVLLTFAPAEEEAKEPESDEIAFFDDFSDPEVVHPVAPSQNSGRDHVSLYEYQRKTKANKRVRRRRALQQQLLQQQQQEAKKKVKWVPLQDFIVEHRNPFAELEHFGEMRLVDAVEAVSAVVPSAEPTQEAHQEDEAQTLLTQEEIEQSWKQFEEATAVHDEVLQLDDHPDLRSGDDFCDDLCYDQYDDEDAEWGSFAASDSPVEEESSGAEDFVLIEELEALHEQEPQVEQEQQMEQFLTDSSAMFESTDGQPSTTVVVKLYYSSSDIHRLGLKRSTFTFAKLADYAGAYLYSKCQLLAKSALPRAFALTYIDDEGDVIHLCSEEELVEALRLHEEVFWVDGKQPILRLHIKSLDIALNDGHIVVGA
jgi:hypothetical protein